MQAASDKTFHLKWNNHLQNLSQLFSAIYSSSALADVTLACRDGTLRAHKLVLSACSPYFEQIFKDNPCKHPVVILKGIPFSEINLLVEFMYKGSVDVQEMDLQSLMHTASELEIRGLAYEVRANAAQLLNVNLEYPAPAAPAVSVASYEAARGAPRTDMERLKQIHLYQQSMLREAERRRRREEPAAPATTAAVKSILAAAAKELADGSSERTTSCVQTEEGESAAVKTELFHAEEETWSRPAKKRVSIFTPEEEKLRRKRLQYEIRQSPQRDAPDGGISKLRISAVTGAEPRAAETPTSSGGGIKVVQLSALQHQAPSEHNSDDEEPSHRAGGSGGAGGAADDDDSYSSGSASESAHDSVRDARPHVCDICDIRFQRASHLNRHRLTHTGERPFTCGGCGKSFARSDKLRVHTKICERDDPTVDMVEECKAEASGEVTAGTVRITHRDSRQLMFTPSGDVMLAPRAPPDPTPTTSANSTPYAATSGEDTPAKRGRGRPKKPVPDVPKIKKRRGRPPKALSGTVSTHPRETLLTYHYLIGSTEPRRRSQLAAMIKLRKIMKKPRNKNVVVQNDVSKNKSSAENEPVKAKRGRKPKNRTLENNVGVVEKIKAKRGRKPKNRLAENPTVSARVKFNPRKSKMLMKANKELKNGRTVKLNATKRIVTKCASKMKHSLKLERTCVVKLQRGCVAKSQSVAEATGKGSRKRRLAETDRDLDMMMGLGNGVSPARFPFDAAGAGGAGGGGGGGTVPMQQHITPSGQQLIVKRKRGRPPKNYFQPLPGGRLPDGYYDGSFPHPYRQYGRPNENYNATNLPFGDFSYLTEMMNYPGGLAYPPAPPSHPSHPFHTVTAVDPERDVDMDAAPDATHAGTSAAGGKPPIDLSSSSSDEGTEPEDAVPAAVCETEIVTVGDCQTVKVPGEPKPEPPEVSENGDLSITAIGSIGDCTVRPLDGNA